MNIAPNCPIRATGITQVDEDHRQLWQMLQQLHLCYRLDQKAQETIKELLVVAANHFAHEETVMARYPELDQTRHRQEHRAFVKRVTTLLEQLQSGERRQATELDRMVAEAKRTTGRGDELDRLPPQQQVVAFLTDWLIRHTNGLDQKWVEQMKRRGIDVQAMQL